MAIRLNADNDTYVYVSGTRKGTVQNNNGGTVVDNVQRGDVNNDGKVDISDAMSIFSWLLEHKPSVFVQSAADFNQDNAITVSDGVAIIASILDTPQSFLSCPDNHHPHMIDLGLPSGTKWACCNVGANKPEEYGGYYAWGETEEKDNYDWKTYIHCDGSESTCHDLGSDISGTQYDVAHVKWGGSWVMPSSDQVKELFDNCSSEWVTQNGVNGRKFTSKNNGSTVFLPAAGYRPNAGFYHAGSIGYYWLSTQRSYRSYYAYDLYFSSGRAYWSYDGYSYYRNYGHTVRPVSK